MVFSVERAPVGGAVRGITLYEEFAVGRMRPIRDVEPPHDPLGGIPMIARARVGRDGLW